MRENDVIDELWDIVGTQDWFAEKIETSKESHKTLIVYVDKMSLPILQSVPLVCHGFHVVVHYIGSIQNKHAAKVPFTIDPKFLKHSTY